MWLTRYLKFIVALVSIKNVIFIIMLVIANNAIFSSLSNAASDWESLFEDRKVLEKITTATSH